MILKYYNEQVSLQQPIHIFPEKGLNKSLIIYGLIRINRSERTLNRKLVLDGDQLLIFNFHFREEQRRIKNNAREK